MINRRIARAKERRALICAGNFLARCGCFIPSRQHPRRLSYPDASPRLRPVPRGNPVSFIPSESAHTCLANASHVLQNILIYLRVCHDLYSLAIFDSALFQRSHVLSLIAQCLRVIFFSRGARREMIRR